MGDPIKKRKISREESIKWQKELIQYSKDYFGGDIKKTVAALKSGKGIKGSKEFKEAAKVLSTNYNKKIDNNSTGAGAAFLDAVGQVSGATAGLMGEAVGTLKNGKEFKADRALGMSPTERKTSVSKELGIKNKWGALATDIVTDPSTFIGAGAIKNMIKGGSKKTITKTIEELGNKYAPNAYKYNPLKTFKEDPNKFYRQVDEATHKEATKSGKIKGRQDIKSNKVGGIELTKKFGDDAYYRKGKLYREGNSPYLYESGAGESAFIPKVNGKTKGFTKDNTSIRVSKTPLSLDKTTVYKKDWLNQYKKLKKGGFLDTYNMKKKKKKLNTGGLATAGLNALVPGAGTAAQIASMIGVGLKNGVDELKQNDIKLKKNSDPFGKMEKGGALESQGMKTYVGPSHKGGGIPINTDGSVGPNGPEVEGKEKGYTYKHINKGTTYVYPKTLNKDIEAIEKKYPDNIQENQGSKELELAKLMKANEKKKASKIPKKELADGDFLGPDQFDKIDPIRKGVKGAYDIAPIPKIPMLSTNRVTKPAPLTLPKSQEAKDKATYSKEIAGREGKSVNADPFKKLANARSIYQAITGITGAGATKRRYNPNEAEVERLTANTLKYDNSSVTNKVIGEKNAVTKDIRASNRGTGVNNANAANIFNNTAQMLANIGINKNATMAARYNQAASTKNALGVQRAAEDIRADNVDDQNKAALVNRGTQIFDDKIELEKFINNRDVNDANFQTNLKMIASKYTGNNAEEFLMKIKNATPEERKKLMEKEGITMNFK